MVCAVEFKLVFCYLHYSIVVCDICLEICRLYCQTVFDPRYVFTGLSLDCLLHISSRCLDHKFTCILQHRIVANKVVRLIIRVIFSISNLYCIISSTLNIVYLILTLFGYTTEINHFYHQFVVEAIMVTSALMKLIVT